MFKRTLIAGLVWVAPLQAEPIDTYYDYVLVDTETAETVTLDTAADALAAYDVVFIGETHRHPANHKAQFDLFTALANRVDAMTLSLEQFERDTQSTLNAFLAGDIGEGTLRRDGRTWDNYPTSYRPLVEFAKDRNWPVIAANAPNQIVRCVGREGPVILETLPPSIRANAAQKLHLEDGAYKTKFYGFAHGAAGHGEATGDAKADPVFNSFAAQVVRDDTMAESIARHIADNPDRLVVHLNGSFHSEEFLGTAERLQWRIPALKIANVHPVHVTDTDDIRESDLSAGTFLLAIKPPPAESVTDDERQAATKAIMTFRAENPCSFAPD